MKPSFSLRVWLVPILCAVGTLLAPLAARGDSCLSTTTCSYNGGQSQTYTVPANCNYITVKVWGSGGACGRDGSAGCNGSYTCASYNVTPGQTCTVTCGGGGKYSGNGCGDSTSVRTPCGSVECGGGGNSQSNSSVGGSFFNATMQSGQSSQSVPCCDDHDYPGGNCGCGGGGGHSDGCNGCVVINACCRQVSQTITFPTPGMQIVGTPLVLQATASSGLAVTYTVNSGAATVSGSTARFTAAGSITITASQAGNSSYSAATPVSVTFPAYAVPAITGPTPNNGKVGTAMSFQVTATGSPTSYSATGLPSGLTINSGSGLVSGTPTSAGTFSAVVTASNQAASGSGTLIVNVSPTYVLTITGSPSAGGSFSGGGRYDPGTVVTVSEVAGAHYRAAGWGGADCSRTASPSSATTTITMNADRNLTAQFVQQVVLTVTSNTGGTATGGGTYDIGSTVPISASPGANYAFTTWTGGSVSNTTAASSSVTMTGNEIVTANFTATYTLTIAGAPAAGGSATGAGTYPAGTVVTITETPSGGYRASGWSGQDAGSTASASSASTTIVMNSNKSLLADFVKQATLTVIAGTGGTATGGGTYDVGSTVPITETASAGYRTNGWTGPNAANVASSTSASTSILVTANETVDASFVQQATLTVVGATGGTATGGGTYDVGSTVPVTETANTGYRTNGWTGSGASSLASPSSASTTIVLNANKTIDASFVQQATLTVVGATGGTATGGGTYDVGSTVPVAEIANTGYRTNGWTGSGASSLASPSSASTTIVLNANKTIDASFVQQGILTVTSGPGGTATGSGTYDVGSTVPITASPAANYAFTTWNGPGVSNPTATSANVTITGNEFVTANFTATYTLTIAGAPVAGGSATGAGTYPAGTVVTITETPSGGYRASGWSGQDAGSTASASSASTTIVMNSNKSLLADFVQQATLTVVAGTGGTATGGGTYDVGSTVPITETANAGYRTSGWTGPSVASVTSPANASTSIVVNANETVDAGFVQQATLTVVAGTGGTATGGGTYDVGSTVPITETANAGYRANGWTGSGVASVTAPSSAATTIVLNANKTVDASFIQQATLTVTAGTGGTATGSGTYDIGSTVPITESASAGYRTNGWTGPGAGTVTAPSSASTTVVLNASETVDASFVQQATLTVAAGTGGTATGSGTYDVGSTVPITETASAGYRTNGWTGPAAGSVTSPSSASTSIVVNASETVDASFVQQATLTVTAGTGGTATGGGTYDIGSTVPISASPAANYAFTTWSGSSVSNPTAVSSNITLTGNEVVTANFTATYTLTIAGAPAAGGSASGAGTYSAGTVVTITETPSGGYRASGWSGQDAGSTASASSPSTTIVMNSNMSLLADFVQQVTLTVVAGTGGSATGSGTYDVGSTVPITETASAGYRATGWSGPDAASVASSSSPSTSIVVNANATVDASFVQQVTLTVTAGTGGTATGGGTYDLGSAVSVTATPAAGYSFNDWTGSDPASATAAATTVTLNGNDTINANFTPQPPTVVLSAAATAYTGSPFHVTSTATAPADNLTLHSIEWLSSGGAWTVSSAPASGGTDDLAVGITFPSTGVWTLRAGVSVDNGTTWVYSPNTQVTVTAGIADYAFASMAVPSASALLWYAPSPVVQKTYQVQHVNP